MSTIQHNQDWLGTHSDWGLTPKKHTELCDELSDHLSEMARVESHGNAQDAKDALSQPKVRRKLAGVHLTDQVYATLNRLPNRKEWRELMWLGLWYVGILLSDWVSLLAGKVQVQAGLNHYGFLTHHETPEGPFTLLVTLAWIFQGLSRAGFFASFFATLWRAWQLGSGVCLARVLQLKLIHTVLVLGAFLTIGGRLWSSWFNPQLVKISDATWFTAPVMLALFAGLAVAVFIVSKRKRWVMALGLLLMGMFMYPAAPTVVDVYKASSPLVWIRYVEPDGSFIWQLRDDDKRTSERAAKISKWNTVSSVDEKNNRYYYTETRTSNTPGTIWDHADHEYSPSLWTKRKTSPGFYTAQYNSSLLCAPVSAPGAALNWLAAPIPLLGIIGLIGMVFIMGRRGFLSVVGYTAICIFAITSTILPFGYVGSNTGILELTSVGVVSSPCPGFEGLLVNLNWNGDWLLIIGLLLSAGIPWLLTSLFLKPGHTVLQADDGGDDAALAD